MPSMGAEPAPDGWADLGFLGALFGVFRPLKFDQERAFGIDVAVEAGSALAADDLAAKGYGPSVIARQFIANAVDHEFAIETIVVSGHIGNSALWALMRCLLEAMAGKQRVVIAAGAQAVSRLGVAHHRSRVGTGTTSTGSWISS